MSNKTTVKIFVASSGELQAERDESLKVIVESNKNFDQLHLEPVLFELDTSSGNNPGFKRIQDKINTLLDNSNIVVVLFYSKVGEFTEEEFRRAIISNKKIFLYLKEGFQPKNVNESNQYTKVLELKETVEKESEIRYQKFKTLDEYNGSFSKDLNKYLSEDYFESKNIDRIDIASLVLISKNNLNLFPYPKPYFIGRDNEIKDFKDAIDKKITFIAIDGPGGIGKTQFVSQCINEFIPKEKILWYECSSTSQLDTIISEAGYPELLKGNSKTDREKFSAFKDKIQENELFLFLDNFQETNSTPVFKEFLEFINEYLQKGCVIVIDRDDIRGVNLTPKRIHISGFKENRLAYANALINHSFKEIIISDDELEKLCNQLQGYPLAIDFAILLLSEGVTTSDIATKIVQEGDVEKISERLLNAIFSRPDATLEEKDFLTQFAAFIGVVSETTVKTIIENRLFQSAPRKLQKKNLLSYSNGNYEIHPLVREFCYKKLEDKEEIHSKIAEFYITQRTSDLSPALEEQIFYHLGQSKQWSRIEREIEEKGRQFILTGQIGLLKELLNKLKAIGIEKPIFDILFGDIAEIQGKWEDALIYYNLAQLNKEDKKIRAEGMIKYGEIFFRKGNINEAIKIYEEAYKFSSKYDFLKEKARALNDIGIVYDYSGELNMALEKYNDALNIGKSINDIERVAVSLFNIGSIYLTKGNYDEAFKKVRETLRIEEQISNKPGMASSLIHLGSINKEKGEYIKALKNYEESLKINQEIGNKQGISDSLNCIGNIDLNKGDYDRAIKNYEESLQIIKEIGNKAGIAAILSNIGLVFKKKNKLNEALIQYEESLKIDEEIENKLGIANTLNNIGSLLVAQYKYDEAIVCFFKALAINKKIGANPNCELNIKWLAGIRDKKLGLNKFKISAQKAYEELSPEIKNHIPLHVLFKEPIYRTEPKTGRNDPCPCGSGKKYKQCHGLPN